MNYNAIAAPAALLLLVLTGCSTSSSAEAEPSPTPTFSTLYGALRACNLSAAAPGFELGDEESSLVIDTAGNDDVTTLGAPYDDALCVLEALDIPDATLNLVETTRALDGRQQGEWDDITATWSYHPDSGLNMTLQADA